MTRLGPGAESALHEGRQAYVAVEASSGPHVTPELFSYSGGRVWFASAVTTVKAKVLARTGVGAVAVPLHGRTVLLRGPVECLDPRRARSLIAAAGQTPSVARALMSFGLRNAPDLVGFANDLRRGRLGLAVPSVRALFALDPVDGAVVERGRVAEGWGGWETDPPPAAQGARPEGIPVVAAVPGPVALPAWWSPDDGQLHLDAGLAALLPTAPTFPVAFTGDEYNAPGPDAKEGVLLRGTAHTGTDSSVLMVELDRLVEWDGVETTSTALGSP